MFRPNRKGFTLIEMLVVIAVVSVLVAIIIPTVSNATMKARAATDAANLRTVLGVANIQLVESNADAAAAFASLNAADSATFPGAKPYIYFVDPGFIIAYYEYNGAPYTVESFAEAASSGKAPEPATLPAGGTPYAIGGSGT